MKQEQERGTYWRGGVEDYVCNLVGCKEQQEII
jgi:hypothetical protein